MFFFHSTSYIQPFHIDGINKTKLFENLLFEERKGRNFRKPEVWSWWIILEG